MRALFSFTCLLNLSIITCFSLHRMPVNSKRNTEESTFIPCIHMEGLAGDYSYVSEGEPYGCGFFLIGDTNQIIEIEFTSFDILCSDGGLLAVVDGWEVQGEIFPSDEDHEKSLESRYRTYCGKNKPKKMFVSSQNVAVIQFSIPQKGQGFKVSIRFVENPRPCNVVSMMEKGTFTMTNYGRKINCSMSIVYPERVSINSINVGETPEIPTQTRETGMLLKCKKRERRDFVELLAGNGMDTSLMTPRIDMCGLDTNPPTALSIPLGCPHSVVRLVSSGHYFNSVTFSYRALDEEEMLELGPHVCQEV